MKLRTVGYNMKQGLLNFGYNKMFSFASIATMTACIFLFGLFYSIVVNFQATVKTAESGVAVTVFFDEGISNSRIEEIGKVISKRPEVSRYNYISAEDAWDTFKQEYFEGREELAEGFADDNPLANSSNYEIYLNDISMQPVLVAYLENLDGVREVHKSEIAANTLADFNLLISYISLVIIAILILVAVFLISNTVAVGISVHSEEIAIMKYIGAKNNFVRGPYVIEGVLIGLIGSVIPLGILYFLYERVITYISDKFSFLEGIITFMPTNEVFKVLLPVGLILGIGIGYVGSRITMAKHMRA